MMRNDLLIAVFCGLLLLAIAGPGRALAAASATVAAPVTEELHYTIDFLVFKGLAEGELRLKADDTAGRYRAELVGRTLGIASWLSGDRVQRYQALMEEDGSGALRSLSYQSSIRKLTWGRWTEHSKHYRFDHRTRTVALAKGKNGLVGPPGKLPLKGGPLPVDMLTAFYNLRRGVYGPLVPGGRLTVPTVTSRGGATIGVEVLAAVPARRARFFPAGGTLLRVTLDPELFDTRGADVYVWFDPAGRPARGIVENLIGLGDVYGYLREENTPP